MAVDVKWNLEEATEISVLSGWDIIRFKKNTKTWTYGVTGKPDVRTITHSNLPALLDKYESVGCGVLVAAPRKEVLKLTSKKMVGLSTKEFDWDDVKEVKIYKHGELNRHYVYVRTDQEEGLVFKLYHRTMSGIVRESTSNWYTYEIEEAVNGSTEFYDHNGERMSYEQK